MLFFPVRMPPFLSNISQLLCVVCGCSEVGMILRAEGLGLIVFSKPCFSIAKDIRNNRVFSGCFGIFFLSQPSKPSAT